MCVHVYLCMPHCKDTMDFTSNLRTVVDSEDILIGPPKTKGL